MRPQRAVYPEPQPVVKLPVSVRRRDARSVALESVSDVPVEIEFIAGVGWAFEVRHDLGPLRTMRQPFTGKQAELERVILAVDESATVITLTAEEHRLQIDRPTGSFEYALGTEVVWRSVGAPFAAHLSPVELSEDIQTLDHRDREVVLPGYPEPRRWSSTMARFQYSATAGPIIGLPGQAGEFNRRGYRFELHNNDQPLHVPSRPPMYQSWPIVFHHSADGRGWCGVFHDNPARTFVDLGDFYRDTVVFEAVTGNTRVYLLAAPSLAEVTTQLIRLLGRPVFPPAWAFGYQQCRYSYMSTEEIRRVAATFRQERIPCDALYFDIDYMDGYRVFTRDHETFGDLRVCLSELAASGFRTVCIVDPGVKAEPGYSVYDRLIAERGVITGADGAPFSIVCWPGRAVLPDFFMPAVRSLWADVVAAWLAEFPFDGIWNDMNEPSNFNGGRVPLAEARSAAGPFQNLHNLYGAGMAEASALGCRQADPHRRALVITRAGYPGVQQHAVIWHGDNHSWWEHLRLAIDTAVGYALCGAFYTGPDVPGFFGNPSEDLAVRFFQLGAFLPLYRGHGFKLARHKEPYAFSPETKQRIKAAIELRYSLMSEWYTGFERAVRTGRPLLEPIFAADGGVVRDSFLLFGALLVAPVTERDASVRPVWLPEGVWYRLGEPGEAVPGGRWLLEPVTLDSIPVFVRGGSILVRHTPGPTVGDTLASPPIYEVYRDSHGFAEGEVYTDDGSTRADPTARRTRLWVEPGDGGAPRRVEAVAPPAR